MQGRASLGYNIIVQYQTIRLMADYSPADSFRASRLPFERFLVRQRLAVRHATANHPNAPDIPSRVLAPGKSGTISGPTRQSGDISKPEGREDEARACDAILAAEPREHAHGHAKDEEGNEAHGQRMSFDIRVEWKCGSRECEPSVEEGQRAREGQPDKGRDYQELKAPVVLAVFPIRPWFISYLGR